jgi:hypothetical protein
VYILTPSRQDVCLYPGHDRGGSSGTKAPQRLVQAQSQSRPTSHTPLQAGLSQPCCDPSSTISSTVGLSAFLISLFHTHFPIMCLVSVKEDDDYAVPARVVKRDRRRSPPRTTRVSRAYYEEPQRPQERTYIIQQPPQPPPIITYAPSQHDHSDHHSHYDPPAPPPPASERHSHHAGPQYVEVTPSSRSSSSSSSSSSDDHRSKTTSRSRATGPQSEYHLREKEVVRERRSPHHYANKEDYATYQYVQPPRSSGHRSSGNLGPRSSHIDDPHASRSSYNARDIVVESSRQREYR